MEKSAHYPRRPNKLIVFGAAGALALGLAGCTSSVEAEPNTNTESVITEDAQPTLRPTDNITTTYYPDGSRARDHSITAGVSYLHITAFDYCEAGDMVTVAGMVSNPETIDRYVAHPACADGMLTPEDFAAPTATPSPAS